jgi:prolyl 4-hydroxylase
MSRLNDNQIIFIVFGIVIIIFIFCALFFPLSNPPPPLRNGSSFWEKFNLFKKESDENLPEYAKLEDPYQKPFVLNHLLTEEQCRALLSYAADKLKDSEVVGGLEKNLRNSKQCWLSKNDPMISEMYHKLAALFNIPFDNAEDLQIVRYLPGQFFKDHHDGCCDNVDKCRQFLEKSGQRILTVLIYLNEDFTGGETQFRNLDLKLKVPPGDAIVFFPTATGTNKCHPLALHAGTSVLSGEKWVANVWFHSKKFNSRI